MTKRDKIIFSIVTLLLTIIIGVTFFDNFTFTLIVLIIGIVAASFIFVLDLYRKSKTSRILIHVVASVLISMILGSRIQDFIINREKDKLNPIINSIETFKKQNGFYPPELEQSLVKNFDDKIDYELNSKNNEFSLTLRINRFKELKYNGFRYE
ncbi:hypothetical protein ACE1ET_20395 [Saccharicrinis sp. FJH62]|uniref:hypothetical protein n=1 Tax=Saccharicrinis sp. FJH62 TaxID=3344657 RepID=UPI0035D4825A